MIMISNFLLFFIRLLWSFRSIVNHTPRGLDLTWAATIQVNNKYKINL